MKRTLVVTALLICLPWLSTDAFAKRLEAIDPETGIRFVLDGSTLTASIAGGALTADTRQQLYGRLVTAACHSTYGEFKATVRTLRWPTGADSVAFTFQRDVSDKVDWCLLERGDGGRDIAGATFGPPPATFLAQAIYVEGDPAPGTRRYLRVRDASGRVVMTRRAYRLGPRLLRPGRYTLIRFERSCIRGCQALGSPRLRCARRFQLRPNQRLGALVRVSQAHQRCRISFRRLQS